jgi:ribosomal protein L35AE/L33A
MKTKLTLFVTVLTAALFMGGCASTYNQADLVGKNGVWNNKETGKPINGKMVEYYKDKPYREAEMKNGIRHGTYTWWMVDDLNRFTGTKFRDELYNHGRVEKHREWKWQTGKQRVLDMWNEDGTPKDRLMPKNAVEDSSLKTWNKADLIEKDGVVYHKKNDQQVTGRVVWLIEGKVYREYIIKNGVYNGYYRWWSVRNRGGKEEVTSSLYRDRIYKDGKLNRSKAWTDYPEGKRLVEDGWNLDGTPKK